MAIDLRNNSVYAPNDLGNKALFPYLGNAACIDSLSITGYVFNGAGFAGRNYGVINACVNNLSSNCNVGICQYNSNLIKNCINNATDVHCGICSISQGGEILNCTNNGNITYIFDENSANFILTGGICASFRGGTYNNPVHVANCVNNGNLIVLKRVSTIKYSVQCYGGICGEVEGYITITNCQNYGNVILQKDDISLDWGIGGIVGRQSPGFYNINKCANYGNIEGKDFVGGIVGRGGWISVTNCMNSGNIKGEQLVAGIDPQALGYEQRCEVSYNLNIGYIESGGAIGLFDGPYISHNYYDKQRCLAKGINNEDIPGKAEGKLTTELTGNSPALRAMLGNGWSYAEGRYPIPLGLENDSSAILHATPVYLYADSVQYDHVDSVRHYFTVGTNSNNVTWASTEGKVSFDEQNATLLSLGSEVLTANMGNYFNSIPINIIDTIPVTFDTIPDHIATIPANSGITIYPNPATNQLKIKNYELRDGDKVEIYNMLGQQQPSILNPQFSIIDISSLPSGIYIIRVGKFVGKFVKQ